LREEKILSEVEKYKSYESETTLMPVGKKNPFSLVGEENPSELELE